MAGSEQTYMIHGTEQNQALCGCLPVFILQLGNQLPLLLVRINGEGDVCCPSLLPLLLLLKKRGCAEEGMASTHPRAQCRARLWDLLTGHAAPALPTRQGEQPRFGSHQRGSNPSKSSVSTTINKTRCLPSCHSSHLLGAFFEPVVKVLNPTHLKTEGRALVQAVPLTRLFSSILQTRGEHWRKITFLLQKKEVMFSISVMLPSLRSRVFLSMWKIYTLVSVWIFDQVFPYVLVILPKSSPSSPADTTEPFLFFSLIKLSGNQIISCQTRQCSLWLYCTMLFFQYFQQ